MQVLDTSAFESCVIRLKDGIARLAQAPGDEVLQESLIKRFEYSYETCLKVLQRALHVIVGIAEDPTARMTLPASIRTAFEFGLFALQLGRVGQVPRRPEPHQPHLLTRCGHGSMAIVPDFAQEMDFLLERLHPVQLCQRRRYARHRNNSERVGRFCVTSLPAMRPVPAPGRVVRALRAIGSSNSDLDIARSDEPKRLIGDWSLEDALEDAPLPFRCEVVILPRLDPAFRNRIEPDFVELRFQVRLAGYTGRGESR